MRNEVNRGVGRPMVNIGKTRQPGTHEMRDCKHRNKKRTSLAHP